MTREEAIAVLTVLYGNCRENTEVYAQMREAIDMAISALSVIEQTKWERDTALATLEEHGIGLGQRAEPKIIKVRKDGTLFVKVLDVSKVHKVEVYDNGDLSKQFGCSADSPTEDYSDLPDIPRAYYEKIVGNMSHEINMLKQQLEDRPSGEWIKDYEKNIYKCSVCGCEEVVPTCMGEPTIWKYCPNCGSVIGARMKGGGE